jgi:hypothetical protein
LEQEAKEEEVRRRRLPLQLKTMKKRRRRKRRRNYFRLDMVRKLLMTRQRHRWFGLWRGVETNKSI